MALTIPNFQAWDMPATRAVAITPADNTDLSNMTRAIWVGGTGNIALITQGGDTITLNSVPGGFLLPICATRVKSTGTTATNLVALW